jgi:hypothetical protein
MSVFEKYLAGWSFRTNRPPFVEGDSIEAFVTGFEDDTAIVRIGDSVLRVLDAPQEALDNKIALTVESFDRDDHTGTGSFIEIVAKGAF